MCFSYIFSCRKRYQENDLLQHPSPVGGQNGFFAPFQRADQQLIGATLEANSYIDSNRTRTLPLLWICTSFCLYHFLYELLLNTTCGSGAHVQGH